VNRLFRPGDGRVSTTRRDGGDPACRPDAAHVAIARRTAAEDAGPERRDAAARWAIRLVRAVIAST
jgi:hypothetical protein